MKMLGVPAKHHRSHILHVRCTLCQEFINQENNNIIQLNYKVNRSFFPIANPTVRRHCSRMKHLCICSCIYNVYDKIRHMKSVVFCSHLDSIYFIKFRILINSRLLCSWKLKEWSDQKYAVVQRHDDVELLLI